MIKAPTLGVIAWNFLKSVASDYVALANQTLEITKLTRGELEQVVYVYNSRGLDYYFFPNLGIVLK